jgi:ribonuclease HI
MTDVKIFIESTWKGPARRDGVAMWLIEYIKANGEPATREGFVHLEDGTEAAGCLMALVNAFCKLKKPCSALVFTGCEHIINTYNNHWHIQWQKNGWRNAKGKEVKNADLWELLIKKADPHVYTVRGGRHEYQQVMLDGLTKEMQRWDKERKDGKEHHTGTYRPV